MIATGNEAAAFGSVLSLRRALRAREISPVEVMKAVLERIAVDEPTLQTWVEIDPEAALEAAARADVDSPLGGVPFGVKDVIDVRGLPTRYGAGVNATSARCDAWCVAAVRAAGAIPVGKLQTTAFAYSDPAPTRNPWDLHRTPGGSSSGSGAAVGARQIPFAFGTQTGGSTLRPAAFNGVAGFKPTFGAIPTTGVSILAPSFDTVGIIARDADDLAAIFSIYDPGVVNTTLTRSPRLRSVLTYREDLAGPHVLAAIRDAMQKLVAGGAVHDTGEMPAVVTEVERMWRTIAAYESNAALTGLVAQSTAGPSIRKLVDEGAGVGAGSYRQALLQRTKVREGLDALFDGCDFIVTPTAGAVPLLGTTGDAHFLRPWTSCGFPAISIPVGFDPNGMPMGMQLIGLHGDDGRLLALARWAQETIALENRGPRERRSSAPA